jgi:hypothetical protein
MGTLQWREHLDSSVRRERRIQWQLGVDLDAELRAPVVESLQLFQRGLSSPGIDFRTKIRRSCPRELAQCVDLYVAEKAIHSDLLCRWLWEAGAEPAKRHVVDFAFRHFRRRFDWAREMGLLLTAEMVSIPFFRVLSSQVDDTVTRQVLESILADQAYHLGFHIDQLRPALAERGTAERFVIQQAWGGAFTSALGIVIGTNRAVFGALDYDPLCYWTDAWNLYAQVQTGLFGSQHLAGVIGRDPRLKFAL